jgi:hypothetical protein
VQVPAREAAVVLQLKKFSLSHFIIAGVVSCSIYFGSSAVVWSSGALELESLPKKYNSLQIP